LHGAEPSRLAATSITRSVACTHNVAKYPFSPGKLSVSVPVPVGEGDGSSIACLNAPDPQKVIGAGNPQASDYSTGADTHKFLVHQLAYNGDVAADQLAVFKARAKCPYLD
jgi:hypothetical protein